MGSEKVIMALLIFVCIYGIIISEKINRTSISLFGAVLMLVVGVLNQEQAIHHVDFNTIGLLVGMMIIVNILRRTGIFEFLAIKAAKRAGGDPWKIIVLFSIITAISSALLDNVTTILLIVPVTLVITDTLEINPIPFMVTEILIANIGGAATLIGDPPNIMIGSVSGLGFTDFLINMGPVVVVVFISTLAILKIIYGRDFIIDSEKKKRIFNMNESLAIKDFKLLKKSGFVLVLTMIGFMLHQSLGLESATIALFGAGILLVISQVDPEEILVEVEWPTIFFFMALFILVGALVEVGIIDTLAIRLINFTDGNLFITAMFILWISAIASAFLDNIPFVATMIPLIKSIELMGTMEVGPLWWALALGACLGGNGTLVGASANVIVSGILEKRGNKLSFGEYIKVGFPLMLVSVTISSVYLMVFYL